MYILLPTIFSSSRSLARLAEAFPYTRPPAYVTKGGPPAPRNINIGLGVSGGGTTFPTKVDLDRGMREMHDRMQRLQQELLEIRSASASALPHPNASPESDAAPIVVFDNDGLNGRIQSLTEEIQRLRSLGAEQPPAYFAV